MTGYLRTNYRTTGGQVGAYAIGKAAVSGSNLNNFGGGFIMGSCYDSKLAAEYFVICAPDAVESYFGGGLGSLSGWRIQPIAINMKYAANSASVVLAWVSVSEGDSCFDVYFGSALAGTGPLTSADAATYRFTWAGFITSAPA